MTDSSHILTSSSCTQGLVHFRKHALGYLAKLRPSPGEPCSSLGESKNRLPLRPLKTYALNLQSHGSSRNKENLLRSISPIWLFHAIRCEGNHFVVGFNFIFSAPRLMFQMIQSCCGGLVCNTLLGWREHWQWFLPGVSDISRLCAVGRPPRGQFSPKKIIVTG